MSAICRSAIWTAVGVACWVVSAHAELAPLPPQPADVPWPTSEWPTGPLPEGVDRARAATRRWPMRSTRRQQGLGETREVAIILGGRLVHEQYAHGYTPEMRLVSWSMAKSITQALVGVAVKQGKVNVDTPMGNPHWDANDKRAQIPWRTWLQMTDGMRYLEIEAKTDRGQRCVAQAVRSRPAGRRELLLRPAADPRAGHALELQLVRHRAHGRCADAHDRAESRIAAGAPRRDAAVDAARACST